MIEVVRIEAKDRDEAIEKALKKLQGDGQEGLVEDDLVVELVEENSGFLGIGKKKIFEIDVLEKENRSEDGSEDDGEEEEIESEDGKLTFKVDEEGIFIQVKLPVGDGSRVVLRDIEELLEAKEIEDVDYDKVSEILAEGIEKTVKVAPRKQELDKDAEIIVEISNDQMAAHLSVITPLGGEEATLDRVETVLEETGIEYGLREERLNELFNEDGVIDKEIEEVLIAEGTEPIAGEDAEIDFKFDLESQERKVQQLEDGSVDYRNLGRINNVEAGSVLATKSPPKPGTPGINVRGEEVEPEAPTDLKIPGGKNTTLSEDGLTLRSDIEGQVFYKGDKIEVIEVHTVNGDLDLSTGNVKFVGTVIVKGDIKDSMKVKAKHDIHVQGSVHAAQLEAGGEVTIKNGFIGKNKGKIEADGDVKAKFIENGKVVTEQNLIVSEAIMHSDIDAAEAIKVVNKGLIVGGMVRAGREIDAKVVGSNLATKTKLFVGVTPALRDQYHELTEELDNYQVELDEALKSINYIKKRQEENGGQLSEKERELLSQKTRIRFQLSKNIEDLKKEKKRLDKRLEEGRHGRVKVQDKLYSGVEITIGTEVKKIGKQISNVQYYVEDGEIKRGSYA
ncbi:FapA family protein [Candidatus Frackibacter sp. WG11]|uniref:FapA family protein n=1 Tax=Candidatus Frackibacter sp. WG11 TaxID=2017976 RepID=UPI0015A3F109|nr:FapA family protein [Candidatus Frackibacter sp. WG11]